MGECRRKRKHHWPFLLNTFDVNTELFTVALDYFANLLTFVVTANHLDFIVLTNRHRPDTILLFKVLGKGGCHQLPPDVGRSVKMALPLLSCWRCDVLVQFHLGSVIKLPVSVLWTGPRSPEWLDFEKWGDIFGNVSGTTGRQELTWNVNQNSHLGKWLECRFFEFDKNILA